MLDLALIQKMRATEKNRGLNIKEKKEGLTNDFTNYKNQADDRNCIQPLPGSVPLSFTILPRMVVVMAMLDAVCVVYLYCLLAGHAGCTSQMQQRESR